MTKTNMSMNKSVWPPLGFVLRSLINAGGYRRYLVERGQDKDLDDIAIEAKNRQSTVAARLRDIEERCAQELAKECGHDWAHFFTQAWNQTRGAMQIFVQQVDASPCHRLSPIHCLWNNLLSQWSRGFSL